MIKWRNPPCGDGSFDYPLLALTVPLNDASFRSLPFPSHKFLWNFCREWWNHLLKCCPKKLPGLLRDPQKVPPSLSECVSVIDGSEFKSNNHHKNHSSINTSLQKKKQNLFYVLFLVLQNGVIIYKSLVDISYCDQMLWKDLEIWKLYEDKSYGIMGNGSFTFNLEADDNLIVSAKTVKKRKKSKAIWTPLWQQQKKKRTKWFHLTALSLKILLPTNSLENPVWLLLELHFFKSNASN